MRPNLHRGNLQQPRTGPGLRQHREHSVEAAFILKDFHRHMEDPSWCAVCAMLDRSFPPTGVRDHHRSDHYMPPELASLVEYLDLPLPDQARLRQIVDETC